MEAMRKFVIGDAFNMPLAIVELHGSIYVGSALCSALCGLLRTFAANSLSIAYAFSGKIIAYNSALCLCAAIHSLMRIPSA